MIPEVVVVERMFQCFQVLKNSVDTVRKGISKIDSMLGGFNVDLPRIDSLKESLRARAQDLIAEISGEIVPTPFDRVSVAELQEDSVWRNLPFSNDNTEKGFRDRLFAETAFQIADDNTEHRIAVITRDKLLIQYFASKRPQNENIVVYPTVDELQSTLRLEGRDLVESVARTIIGEARLAFCDEDRGTGLFFDENLREKINTQYPSLFPATHFEDPILGDGQKTAYSRSEDEAKLKVGETSIVDFDSDGYVLWETKMCSRKGYVKWAMGADFSPPRLTLKADLVASWKSKVEVQGRGVSDVCFSEIVLKDVAKDNPTISIDLLSSLGGNIGIESNSTGNFPLSKIPSSGSSLSQIGSR